jgi:hypothetical protein
MERIPGSGRAKGTQNRQTALRRAGIKNAIETLRTGEGEDPIAAAFKIAKLLEDMSAKRLEKFKNEVADLPPDEFARIQVGLIAAANLHVRLAEFAFPKLARVDHVGDAPSLAAVKNRMVVTLKLGDLPRPALSGRHDIEGHAAVGAIGHGGDKGHGPDEIGGAGCP